MRDERRIVDIREIGQALRRGWPIVAACAAGGVLFGILLTKVVPERYVGRTTVLVRSSPDVTRGALSQLGGLAEVLGGGLGVGSSELDTELEILVSRGVVGAVVDELRLEAEVLEPTNVTPSQIFADLDVADRALPSELEFVADGNGYRVSGEGVAQTAAPGALVTLPEISFRLQRSSLPQHFRIRYMDREDAIGTVQEGMDVSSVTADVAELIYRAPNAAVAAEVPNRLVSEYLSQRRVTDRGINRDRYEFLVAHADSVATELGVAEDALRQHQETSGVIDPALVGETRLQRAMELESNLETIDIEAQALRRLLQADNAGEIPPQELAAFPTFFRNAAINDVLARMLELETQRVGLLQRRTGRDDDVVALTEGIDNLEVQLRSLARAYLSGLTEQRQEVQRELGNYREILDALPAQTEESLRRQRDVERLSAIQLALQTQLVQARLAAMGEGGEVRQIDEAQVPRKPSFPSAKFLIAFGLIGGLFFGTAGAVAYGLSRGIVSERWEIEHALGIPAAEFGPGDPLALPGIWGRQSILVIPINTGAGARMVGERFVETATVRGQNAILVDLREPQSDGSGFLTPGEGSNNGLDPMEVALPTGMVKLPVYRGTGGETGGRHRATVASLEERFSLVVAVVPSADHPTTISLLTLDRPVVFVARRGVATRDQLTQTVQKISQLGGEVAGVVLVDAGSA